VMAHETEPEAFQKFLDVFPEGSVLLIDTYDVHNAVREILRGGRKPAGVRLDSGNLVKDSLWVRRELDRAGWKEVKVFASGDLDEFKIAKLVSEGAAIDSFGVGTALATPGDAPHLNMIYKLVEVEGGGKVREAAKFSHAKATYPGRKQVFRRLAANGEFAADTIALAGEASNGGEPLLIEVMRSGRRLARPEPIRTLRDRSMANLRKLPRRYRQILRSAVYPVRYSKRLTAMRDRVKQRVRRFAIK
jgi:nicotinate phosphoribosyltransferase